MKLDFKSISMATFCAFAIKCLILQDITIVNALCLAITALFVGFYEYKSSHSQLKEQQNQIDALKAELAVLRSTQSDIITNLSSVKTSINMKSSGNRSF